MQRIRGEDELRKNISRRVSSIMHDAAKILTTREDLGRRSEEEADE